MQLSGALGCAQWTGALLRPVHWESARAILEQAAKFGESAETLAGLGEALQFAGGIEPKERAFADCERGGLQAAEAAELARGLAFLHGSAHGNRAVATSG